MIGINKTDQLVSNPVATIGNRKASRSLSALDDRPPLPPPWSVSKKENPPQFGVSDLSQKEAAATSLSTQSL